MHAALLHDFTGQTIEQLNKTGIVYVGLGFSYQAPLHIADYKTQGELSKMITVQHAIVMH